MFGFILRRIFGTKHERDIKRLQPLVEEINSLEPAISRLSDQELKVKKFEFRKRIDQTARKLEPELKELSRQLEEATSPEGRAKIKLRAKGVSNQIFEDVLPEAFAVVREAGRRAIGMRQFDVQLIGGMVLHQGKIAEMATGEGKTLVATLAAYLNALTGEGVHIVTVNDYLARRDTEWMGPIYDMLGLSVGVIQHDRAFVFSAPGGSASGGDIKASETGGWELEKVGRGAYLREVPRQEAYNCDVTYGTNNEFGFDYLRDNMAIRPDGRVQRKLHYAIVDEVDSILIDEARTPLIISGPAEESTDKYDRINRIIPNLRRRWIIEEEEARAKREGIDLERGYDASVDEKASTWTLTEEGEAKCGQLLGIDLSDPKDMSYRAHIIAAGRAHDLFKRDVDYVVKDGQVIIVDEFTGRLMPGRRWSEGLHQAIEAKENLRIARENQTLATITFQNYFRLYEKLAGMTGTADTEAGEFNEIYKLDVVVIPPNRPLVRYEWNDVIYKTEREKFNAVADEIAKLHQDGRPVLIGTVSVEKSERLSALLRKRGVPHEVLNAKNHEREAHIIAQAGQRGAVTLSTNMAGRGTDIVLGPGIAQLGGLHVVGTERHEARRVDNQLRGRAGRQGDPGSSRFFLSLEDDLMRLFGSDRIASIMDRLHLPENQPIEHPLVTRAITTAQKRVEVRNFDIRKHLLEYDNVMEKQRDVIYEQRRLVLEGEDLSSHIMSWIEEILDSILDTYIPEKAHPDDWDLRGLIERISQIFPIALQKEDIDISQIKREGLREMLLGDIRMGYQAKEARIGPENMRHLERLVMLQVIDERWKEHLRAMDDLKEGIGLRGYGGRDPLMEYKREGFEYFDAMIGAVKQEVVELLFRVRLVAEEAGPLVAQPVPAQQFVHPRYSTYELAERAGHVRQAGGPAEGWDTRHEESSAKPMPYRRSGRKIGRNEPCPCGSGLKYKKCCGRNVH
jgi:preprotein translocase subunit SecA